MDYVIYTGYAWRLMTEAEKEIMAPERVLAEQPDRPEAGDILEVTE